ncbi:MAG: hypothetical protein JWN48_535 [Myxococcaceae bacterium]|nr:hypothetical protein [Myxococcaceae bacterium]
MVDSGRRKRNAQLATEGVEHAEQSLRVGTARTSDQHVLGALKQAALVQGGANATDQLEPS